MQDSGGKNAVHAFVRRLAWFCLLASALSAYPASAKSYIYAFKGGSDGDFPTAGLVADKSGDLFGTTTSGGSGCSSPGCGTVFEKPANGNETVLHSFTGGSDGAIPESTLVIDSAGRLFGTASVGGGSSGCGGGCGVVFEVQHAATGWTERILYSFCSLSKCSDGATPVAGLAMDSSGNLYGTTYNGGTSTNCASGCGTIFELSNNGGTWTETVLYSFCGCSQNNVIDGAYPHAPLLLEGSSGSLFLFGTTEFGGNSTNICSSVVTGCGTVFALSNVSGTWAETQLYAFCPTASSGSCSGDGSLPVAGLLSDSFGNLFGTTSQGGSTGCCLPGGAGTLFEIQPDGAQYGVVYEFCSKSNCTDGEQPMGLLTTDGTNIYGTTLYGGLCTYCGVLFSIGQSGGSDSVIHAFCSKLTMVCVDGDQPYGGVLYLKPSLYGLTSDGGTQSTNCPTGCGVVFQYKKAVSSGH
jgi:uncharacterized repeat protein (TIGR03803 family)